LQHKIPNLRESGSRLTLTSSTGSLPSTPLATSNTNEEAENTEHPENNENTEISLERVAAASAVLDLKNRTPSPPSTSNELRLFA
jgi:hypothetical protein